MWLLMKIRWNLSFNIYKMIAKYGLKTTANRILFETKAIQMAIRISKRLRTSKLKLNIQASGKWVVYSYYWLLITDSIKTIYLVGYWWQSVVNIAAQYLKCECKILIFACINSWGLPNITIVLGLRYKSEAV